jgi:putative Mg2+ transporter-C (MgtC) family protein
MSFGAILHNIFTNSQYLEFALRLVIACAVGLLIGVERSSSFRGVGSFTHMMVCCAAALIMIISKYGFADLSTADGGFFAGVRGADASRIAAQSISGISFLCAGVIFKNGSSIKGLTTAAGIWTTLALGLAIGAGMYVVAAAAYILLFIISFLFKRFPIGFDRYRGNHMVFTVTDDEAFFRSIEKQIKVWETRKVSERTVKLNNDGTAEFELTVYRKTEIKYEDFKAFLAQCPEIKNATLSYL